MSLGYVDAKLNDVTPWDGSRTKLSPGDYVFEVVAVEDDATNDGDPKMSVQLKAVEAFDEENEGHVGEIITTSYSFNFNKAGNQRRLRSFIDAALGGPDEKGGFQPEDLVGAQIIAEVELDSWERPLPDGSTQTTPVTRVLRERPVEQEEKAEPAKKQTKAASNSRGRGRRRRADAAPN